MKRATIILMVLFGGLQAWAGTGQSSNFLGVTKDGKSAGFILKETRVHTVITGNVAHTEVTQSFENPFKTAIEGVYFFPLPESSAVNEMLMLIGERLIAGQIKNKKEAREIYDNAKKQGKRTALLEQRRDNLFKQSVANIMPGETVRVRLRFIQPVLSDKAVFSYRFPTVIGPRYGKEDALAELHPQYVRPGTRLAHKFSIDVVLKSYVGTEFLKSASHTIDVKRQKSGNLYLAQITNQEGDRTPNKDFVLTWKFWGKSIGTSLLLHKSAKEDGYFLLMLTPPDARYATKVAPREMFFILDTSGSMSGTPLRLAKTLMKEAIRRMNPEDTFQVYTFSTGPVAKVFPTPVPWSKENIERALQHIDTLRADGGTEIIPPLKMAQSYPLDPKRLRVIYFLSDGYVSYEKEILQLVKKNNSRMRLFPVGVGSAPNSYLFTNMARAGRGFFQYFGPTSDAKKAAREFYEKISKPVLVDIKLAAKGITLHSLANPSIPDLFAGQPLFIVGRYSGVGPGSVTVSGRLGTRPVKLTVSRTFSDVESANSGVKYLWASRKIKSLLADERYFNRDVKPSVEKLGLEYHLVTKYTSFVAVENKVVNKQAEQLKRILAKAHLPEGTRWDGFVGKDGQFVVVKAQKKVLVVDSTLEPDRFQPGDPEIVVQRTNEMADVISLLPWGERIKHTFVERTNQFVGRFLVPDSVSDGLYRVNTFIRFKDGQLRVVKHLYRVDRQAPKFQLDVKRSGNRLLVTAIPQQHVFEGRIVGRKKGVTIRHRVDVKYVRLFVDGKRVVMTYVPGDGVWRAEVTLAGIRGTIALSFTAVDFAENATRIKKTIIGGSN